MLDMMSVGTLSGHGVIVMAFTVVVFVLFAWDRWPIQSVCLAVLIALPVLFTVFPYFNAKDGVWVKAFDFFGGFGHEALIAIFALMILGHALVLTGALDPAARKLTRLLEVAPRLALLIVLIACASASDPEWLTQFTNSQIMRRTGTEGIETIMWLVMRGALQDAPRLVHKHYHVPISNTGAGVLVLEN